jgi:hypothetical protein
MLPCAALPTHDRFISPDPAKMIRLWTWINH